MAFFHSLGFDRGRFADISSRQLYAKGQYSIPSDTACYPAKLMHGHIENLLDKGVDTIFYPCLTYNFDEEKGDNHYNCPVVAYYPELLARQHREAARQIRYLYPYLRSHRAQNLPQEGLGGVCTSISRTITAPKRSKRPPTRPMQAYQTQRSGHAAEEGSRMMRRRRGRTGQDHRPRRAGPTMSTRRSTTASTS